MTFHKCMRVVVSNRNILAVVVALGLSGCAVVGPKSITAGRGAYAEVINRTEDEQILNVLVRQRYDETFGMISVASITANLQFSAKAGTNIGVGDNDNYAGNLVPFSAGVGYEENPTISYTPLSGQEFTRRMLSRVSSEEWILLGITASHPGRVLAMAAQRVNGLRNPLPGEGPPSPRFARFVELFDQLRRAGAMDVVKSSQVGSEHQYFWDIHDYQDAHVHTVREFLDLIDIEAKLDGSAILLPIREAIGSSSSAINVQARSAYDVLRLYGAGIEVPKPHLESGIVAPLASAVAENQRVITIRSSTERPDNATVRVRFRDWWFYIDATDTLSKRAFMFLRTFIGMRLATPGAAHNAPVITIPVK